MPTSPEERHQKDAPKTTAGLILQAGLARFETTGTAITFHPVFEQPPFLTTEQD